MEIYCKIFVKKSVFKNEIGFLKHFFIKKIESSPL